MKYILLMTGTKEGVDTYKNLVSRRIFRPTSPI